MIVGLCVEEIAVNVIEHGFTKDKHSLGLNNLYMRFAV